MIRLGACCDETEWGNSGCAADRLNGHAAPLPCAPDATPLGAGTGATQAIQREPGAGGGGRSCGEWQVTSPGTLTAAAPAHSTGRALAFWPLRLADLSRPLRWARGAGGGTAGTPQLDLVLHAVLAGAHTQGLQCDSSAARRCPSPRLRASHASHTPALPVRPAGDGSPFPHSHRVYLHAVQGAELAPAGPLAGPACPGPGPLRPAPGAQMGGWARPVGG